MDKQLTYNPKIGKNRKDGSPMNASEAMPSQIYLPGILGEFLEDMKLKNISELDEC